MLFNGWYTPPVLCVYYAAVNLTLQRENGAQGFCHPLKEGTAAPPVQKMGTMSTKRVIVPIYKRKEAKTYVLLGRKTFGSQL